MKGVAIFPGAFDPMTVGHVSVIERACAIFDKVIIAISHSRSKGIMFNLGDRVEIVHRSIDGMKRRKHGVNIDVMTFDGTLVEFACKNGVFNVIRGVRCAEDFSREYNMYNINRLLEERINTVFIPAKAGEACISSSAVRELLRYRCDVSAMVMEGVAEFIRNSF